MTDKELKELLKTKTPHRILSLYANRLISLTSKQINFLIEKKKNN